MALILLLVLSVVAPVVALIIYGFHPIQRWRYRHIPGPRPRWLIGNLLDIHREGQEGAAARWAREYGPVWCVWMGAWPVVMTDDPELARKVLAKPARHKIWCMHRGKERDYEDHTLFYANGERWRASRAAWTPFFSRPAMQAHSVRMGAATQHLGGVLQAAADSGAELDVWRSLGQLTMDIIGAAAFGVQFQTSLVPSDDLPGQPQPAACPADDALSTLGGATPEKLLWAVRTVFEVCGPANPVFALCFLFPEGEGLFSWLLNAWPNAPFRRELKARKVVKAVGSELLAISKQTASDADGPQAPSSGGASGGTDPNAAPGAPIGGGKDSTGSGTAAKAGAGRAAGGTVDPGSFLPVVGRCTGKVVEGVVMDDDWATNQATTFLVAGYETTANALAFCVYLLATNPGKEAKLLAEIDAFGRDRPPTSEDVQAALPYSLAVVRESMRIYPPSVVALRETAGPMQLGRYPLPAGTAMQVSLYSMHRNPRHWREPLAFRPERFVPGTPDAAEVVPGAYIPFGGGTRECVGARFAEVEAVVSLVCLYQQFTFRLLPGQVPLKTKTLITHGPADGVRVTVHRRN